MQRCRRIRILAGAAVVAMAFFSGASAALAAGPLSPAGGGASNEPIEIVSDRLVNNNTDKVAEFTGKVKADAGQLLRHKRHPAHLLRGRSDQSPEGPVRQSSEGPVHQKPSDKNGGHRPRAHHQRQVHRDSDRAEYDPATDILTLIGENSRVTSGQNSVTGSKIIINRRDGTSVAESSGTDRVKAVLHQEPKQAEGPKAGKPAEKKQ